MWKSAVLLLLKFLHHVNEQELKRNRNIHSLDKIKFKEIKNVALSIWKGNVFLLYEFEDRTGSKDKNYRKMNMR